MKKIIFIFLMITQCLSAQRIGKILNGEYYGAYGLPTRIGDAWNYWNYQYYHFRPEFKIELIDTVRINGEKYFRQKKETDRSGNTYSTEYIRLRDDGFYVILDTVFGGPLRNKQQDYIYYKKNAQVGDYWIQKRNVPIDRFIYHKIIDSSIVASLWGTWIRTKVVDVTDSVLTHYRENWSEEFGMVRLPYRLVLWGCVVNGVKYGDTTLVSVEEFPSKSLTNFELYQNYPNPFNAVTIIQYQVHKTSYVKLKVYDLLGNEVALLVDKEKPSGRYTVEFDAEKLKPLSPPASGNSTWRAGLSSGTYFYELTVNGQRKARKMSLIK
jgi:hypothetical protein